MLLCLPPVVPARRMFTPPIPTARVVMELPWHGERDVASPIWNLINFIQPVCTTQMPSLFSFRKQSVVKAGFCACLTAHGLCQASTPGLNLLHATLSHARSLTK